MTRQSPGGNARPAADGWLIVVDDASLGRHLSGRSGLTRLLRRSTERRLSFERSEDVVGWAVTGHHSSTSAWAPGPVGWLADFGEEAPLGTVRADPVHLLVGPRGLAVAGSGDLGIDISEAERMCAAIMESLGDRIISCRAGAPDRWYLTMASAPQGDWFMPEEMAGRDLLEGLPDGDEGTDLRQLLNEVQMVLHQQADNEKRRERGIPDVNSIWLWGWCDGKLPRVGSRVSRVYSSHPYATGLARMAGVEARGLEPPAREIAGDGAVISGMHDDLEWIGKTWCAPLMRAFDRGRIERLRLVTTTGRLFEPTRGLLKSRRLRPGRSG